MIDKIEMPRTITEIATDIDYATLLLNDENIVMSPTYEASIRELIITNAELLINKLKTISEKVDVINYEGATKVARSERHLRLAGIL